MPFEDDEARRAARERLRARQARSGRAGSPSRAPSGRSGRAATTGRDATRAPSRPANPYDGWAAPRASRNRRASRPRGPIGKLAEVLPDSIPPIFVIGVTAALVALLVFGVIMPSCSNRASRGSVRQADDPALVQEATENTTLELDKGKPHQAALAKLIGDEPATALLRKATADFDALWVAAHPESYAFDGMEVQYEALKLAADEPEALPFVRALPRDYPVAAPSDDAGLALPSGPPSEDVPASSFPHLYQWDLRWANTGFAGTAFGITGGGPTCLAMVRAGLTGDDTVTPYDIGQSAEAAPAPASDYDAANAAGTYGETAYGYGDGAYDATGLGGDGAAATGAVEVDQEAAADDANRGATVNKQGMRMEYLFDGASDLGLQCSQLYPSFDGIRDALLQGQAIVLVVDAGHFGKTERFVVLTGIAGNGKAIMNDPSSMTRSSQLWDIDELVGMSSTMFAYWV